MAINEICEKLERLLSARQGVEERIESAVGALSRVFTVEPGEVAIFSIDDRLECFNFLWPPEMRSSGAIPFSANRSLVATTASERRGIMSNGFASTPHLFVFESYGREKNPPIQKIMSVPMLDGDQLKGVIQVCRKGEDGEASLKNFTEPELAALSEMAKVIGRYLQ